MFYFALKCLSCSAVFRSDERIYVSRVCFIFVFVVSCDRSARKDLERRLEVHVRGNSHWFDQAAWAEAIQLREQVHDHLSDCSSVSRIKG